MLTATAYDTHVEQLFGRMQLLHQVLTTAGIPYRLVGGLAVFLHVAEQDPLQARLTSDIDAAIDRSLLRSVIDAVASVGWVHRHVRGVDMLVEMEQPRARSAVHLVFLGEKIYPDYLEPVPASAPTVTREGILLAPVSDLVVMKLTSFRLKDQVHIQDMDSVGLITPEIEASLPAHLLPRLRQVRASR